MSGAGTATYALLALPFFAAVAVVAVLAGVVAARRARAAGRRSSAGPRVAVVTSVVVGVVLVAMTMVFDNVIVALRVVAYDWSLVWGAKIGVIPVEDLAYSVAAVVLLPSLWVLFDRTGAHDRTAARDRTGAHDRNAPRDRTGAHDRTDRRPAPDPTTPRAEDPE